MRLHSATSKIKVMHFITDLELGGSEMALARLVLSMNVDRFSHLVVSLCELGPLGTRLQSCGIEVRCLNLREPWRVFGALVEARAWLREYSPHIVQSWLYHADLFAYLVTRGVHRGVLVWNLRCSTMDFSMYSRRTAWIVKALSRLSQAPAAIVANSTAGIVHHKQLGYRARRWEYIPNGFNSEEFKPDDAARTYLRAAAGVAADCKLIGMIARVDPMKDHLTLLDAVVIARHSLPDLHCVLIGKGTESLQLEVARRGLTEVVKILGARADISQLLPGLDVLVLSSITEGFPNTIGEAMAAGVPCIATDTGDVRFLLAGIGAIVPVRDSAAISTSIKEVFEMPSDALAARRKSGRQKIIDEYSQEHITSRYASLYEELAHANKTISRR
jgi:glycosyltransferase involved in cell wall biosynthesis